MALVNMLWRPLVARLVSLLLMGLMMAADISSGSDPDRGGIRWKRETEDPELESTTEGDGLPPIEPVPGPSLGEILGLVALVITILYVIGMSWKIIKIFKGEYVPTEPVYLKYK